jgi:hypothetical protein
MPRIALRVANLRDAMASFESAGARVQLSLDGHVLVEPPPGVFLELIEENL